MRWVMKINAEKLQNLNTDEYYDDEYYDDEEYDDDEEYEEYEEDNSKRNKIIIGGFIATLILAGVGAMYLFGGSPKTTFLERLNTYYTTEQMSQSYKISAESNAEGFEKFEGLSLTGTATKDGKNGAFTLDVQGEEELMGASLPEAEFVYYNKNMYLNTDLAGSYLSMFSGIELEKTSSFANLKDLLSVVMGEESFKEYESEIDKATDSAKSGKLQEEIQGVLADYLKELDGKKFTEKDGVVTLKLNYSELKTLAEKILTTMSESDNYEGDKTQIKDAIEAINSGKDKNADASLQISLGSKVGNTTWSVTAKDKKSKDEITVTIETKDKKFNEITEPENLMTKTELENYVNDIRERIAKAMTTELESSTETSESTTEASTEASTSAVDLSQSTTATSTSAVDLSQSSTATSTTAVDLSQSATETSSSDSGR